jgi:hypothetical protein
MSIPTRPARDSYAMPKRAYLVVDAPGVFVNRSVIALKLWSHLSARPSVMRHALATLFSFHPTDTHHLFESPRF